MKEMVAHMVLTRDQTMVLPLQKWFEVDMPAGGVTPDAITFAIMIRMALRMLHGSKRDRTVRRYWELAQNAEVEEELVGIEVLEDSDVGELSKVRLTSGSQCYSYANVQIEDLLFRYVGLAFEVCGLDGTRQ
jgi:DNA-directed RNA polymerase